MDNQLNSGSLDTLTTGHTLLIAARKIKGDKISLEFAEDINSSDKPRSILADLNYDDERFSTKFRRAWMSGSAAGITKVLGIDVSATADWYMDEKGEMLDLNVLDPIHLGHNKRMRMVITESTEPTENEKENVSTTAKRKGKDGDFITHQGANVWSRTTMTTDKVEHTYLTSDAITELETVKDDELVNMI